MTDIDAARRAILDLGSEDYYHLADAAVYLPSVAPEQRGVAAREAMRQLLREGLVQIYFGRMASNDVTAVPLEAALREIEDPHAWDAEHYYPDGYCFANTDAGDAVYRGEARHGSGQDRPNER